MVVYVGIALIVLLVVVIAMASTRPDTFVVERAILIAAPPAAIEPHLSDFHRWAAWSPWEHLDPAMQKTFTGAESGVGAIYTWEGNAKAGAGRMEILTSAPTATEIQLDFYKPFPSRMRSLFTLHPQAAGTQLKWTMSGPQKLFPNKVMSLFMNMDAMIGGDFERGLASIKTIVETPAA